MARFARLALSLAVLVQATAAHPHVVPPVFFDLKIESDGAAIDFEVLREIVQKWVGTEVEAGEAHDEIEARFRERNLVEIDGERVTPTLQGLRVAADPTGVARVEALKFTLIYKSPSGKKPRKVSIVWDDFEDTMWDGELIVPGLAKDPPQTDLIGLRPDEPAFVWHARQQPAPPKPKPAKKEAPPQSPLTSIAFLIAAVVGVFASDTKASAIGIVAVFSLAAWGFAPRAAPPPAPPTMPEPDRAIEIFSELHGNIYRAFQARSENEIYDLLAESVTHDLLAETYGQVFESLVLREQGGGAVASIESVDVIEKNVELGPTNGNPLEYVVEWKWHVVCAVSHWGHAHRRRNEYAALYTVRHVGDGWRIAATDLKEHRRIELEEDDG